MFAGKIFAVIFIWGNLFCGLLKITQKLQKLEPERICTWPHFESEVLSVEHGNDLLVYKANRCLNCVADEFLERVKVSCL